VAARAMDGPAARAPLCYGSPYKPAPAARRSRPVRHPQDTAVVPALSAFPPMGFA